MARRAKATAGLLVLSFWHLDVPRSLFKIAPGMRQAQISDGIGAAHGQRYAVINMRGTIKHQAANRASSLLQPR